MHKMPPTLSILGVYNIYYILKLNSIEVFKESTNQVFIYRYFDNTHRQVPNYNTCTTWYSDVGGGGWARKCSL